MIPTFNRFLVLSVVCSWVPTDVHAYNPWNDWRTVTTPHFRIHYPVGYHPAALEFGRAAEALLEPLVLRLGWRPSTPIDFVLNDDSDSANGFARSLPYNLVGVNAVAPADLSVLNDYDDWRYLLVAHELTHIIQIDTVRGLPAFFNVLFGRQLVPNSILPRWLIEGMAVYFESSMTSAGRLRSSLFNMMLRMHILSERELSLGELSGAPQRWPQGTSAYLYGGFFAQFIVEEFGEDFFRRINLDYGDDLIPFGVNITAKRAVGETYPELYRRFVERRHQEDLALASRIERQGRVEGQRVTFDAQGTGPARFGDDGTLYFIRNPIDDRPQLRRWVATGESVKVGYVEADADLALMPGQQTAIVSFADINKYYRVYQDLYRIDLQTGARTQLTHGARAMSPDVSNDGRLVYVQLIGGRSVVRLASVDEPNASRILVDLGDNAQVFTPRFVDDDRAVVFSAFRDGQRDLYRVEIETGAIRALTQDRFIDGGAAPSADGRSLFFHSDRDGIYNIYLMPVSGGEVRRITRVVGGAFRPSPSPDGRRIAYQSYSAEGFDISVLELPEDLSNLPTEKTPVSSRPPVVEVPQLEVFATGEYSVWPSILPRSWLPVLGTDTQGTTAGVAVTGVDAIEEHEYALQLTYGLESNYTGFTVQYANGMFHPGFSLSASRRLGFANVPFERNGGRTGVEESVWDAQLGVTLPIWSRIDDRLNLRFGYEISRRQRTGALVFDPLDASPIVPSEGRFASVVFGASASNVRAYSNSISQEEGARAEFDVKLESPATGSEFRSIRTTASFSAFVENPWLDRHVLALEASAAYGASNYEERALFGISGLPATDLVLDILNLESASGSALRGFPLEPIAGDTLTEAHLEYRFPIWDVQGGVDTLPVFFGNASAAPFLDMASVADSPSELFGAENRYASAGAEIRVELLLGYSIDTTLRAGYGVALRGADSHAGYIVLGGAF